YGFRSACIEHRRLRGEQTKLERWLLGVLNRKPAIVTVARVRVHAEPELLDVEIERFLLIADVETDHSDTLAHGTSVASAPSIARASRRRFSETAILRLGRYAALTKQAGTCS